MSEELSDEVIEEEVEEVELDIRGELEAAMKPEADEVEEVQEGRARDEKGRFAAKETPEEAPAIDETPEVKAETAPEEEAPVEASPAPPNGWTAEAKEKWHELPAEVQAAVAKRELDVAKFTSKSDEERQFGRDMYKAVNPYLAQIQAEGGTPQGAVQSLLNTAYLLRTGSPDQKRQMLLQTAKQFGVDLSDIESAPEIDPKIAPLYQKINQLEGMLTQQTQAGEQQLQTEVQSEVDAFASDPANSHFEEVEGYMAALLQSGKASDLKDAYDQACWASPGVRATLLAQRWASEEQKRRADAKAKAEAAKRKGSSLIGGPGVTSSSTAPEDRSIAEELRHNMAALSGAV